MVELENELSKSFRELSCKDDGGFVSLPHQIMKKYKHAGFVFNLLLLGETGIGKSTLVSSLFHIFHDITSDTHVNSEVTLKSKTYNLFEKEVNLSLTVVETVGYGDQINRCDNTKPIIKYLECQLEKYLQEELSLQRTLDLYKDPRIHACLYFIAPTGHSLKSIDLYCMQQLQDRVNIIPIVAKSDSLSKEELRRFKMAIKADIEAEKIAIYRFPIDDEEFAHTNSKWNDYIPFAVSSSADFIRIGDKLTRARIFPWGTMLVADEEHSEFLTLKKALIDVNMEDLREKTHSNFYERYRKSRLIQLGFPEFLGLPDFNLQELYRRKRDELHKRMLQKEEKLLQKYRDKVKKKDEEFKAAEVALQTKYDKLFEIGKMEEQKIRSSKFFLDQEIASFKRMENSRRYKI